jgi:hypothetical protein
MCLKRDFYESLVQKMVPLALEMIPQASEMVPRALEMVPQISETIPQTPVGTKFVQDQLFVKVRTMDSRRLF